MSTIDLSQLITAEQKSAAARAEKFAALADLRWQRETGGVTLPDGLNIITTRESQAQIAGVVQSISAGLIVEPIDWKLASGWVGISAAQMTELAQGVADHVKRCFTAERSVYEHMQTVPGDLSGYDLGAAFEVAYALPLE